MQSKTAASADVRETIREVLGYLNFSSGAPDPAFLKNLGELFARVDTLPAWKGLAALLRAELQALRGSSDAFRRIEQAEAVLGLVFEHAAPAYRRFHRDLLFHQTDEQLYQPFFLGRMCQAVLQQGGPWNETQRIVDGTIRRLNDYIGYRPVAVLETAQKIQPYAHEWLRPVPLWIRAAGAAPGPYRELVAGALRILEATESSLLFDAWFDPDQLDELAMDPRAYDFDHPVNKRPNYLFGQWDIHSLDNSARYRRFVVQQVALDAMLARLEDRGELPYEELLFEESAVLAGTMLMGSGISGNRPDAHDSDTSLPALVRHIAAYRDAFYERLLGGIKGPHAQRLKAEARRLRQPFGGARQHFNQHLARRRAEQLQHVHLAQLFARMGYTDAAARQVRIVPVASARMLCDLYCRMAAAHRDLTQGRPEAAAEAADELEDLLHRCIECGAQVDPWNILGFDGQFSLFPAPENSVHDHRVDELIHLMSEIFGLYGQIEKEAAAAGNAALKETVSQRIGKLAEWWDRYASVEVGSVEGISGHETRESADHVAAALGAWHEAGSAAGDLAFWREHIEQFRSPKAYAVVVEALLQQRDPVAAMALLVQWLSRAEQIPLIEEHYAFQDFALDWMEDLWRIDAAPAAPPMTRQQRWALTRKFFDYLEANAEEYWEVPRFELAGEQAEEEGPGDEEDELEDLFRAAYEGVTYRDSTDDGFEGEMLEGGGETDFEFTLEAERIVKRLGFLTMLAQLWRLAAMASMPGEGAGPDEPDGDRDDVLAAWLRQATLNRRQLQQLLAAVHRYRIPAPRGTHEALVEYDQRRGVKETLLEQVIAACVETADAASMIRAAVQRDVPDEGADDWQRPGGAVLRALLRGDAAGVRRQWRELLDALSQQPLLYVALARGGSPRRIVASRILQALLRRLLAWLPRLGLLQETYRLIETVQDMEIDHPVGHGAITEFDQMFEIGCKAIVRCLVASSEEWHGTEGEALRASDLELIDYLEKTAEALLRCWLAHSRGVRLSVLETVNNNKRWGELKRFIERYGGDLFTQQFLNLGNLRAILHQGVDRWLQSLAEEPDDDELLLMRELRGRLSREDAAGQLSLVLEAVAENYPEYVDYNSTTTQSDRGEMLYTLLDFLRLRAQYDRVAWNLQPVVLAHEVLMRCGRDEAAEIWRQAVAERTADIADDHLKRLDRLTGRYAMRLPSVAERLGERFIRPLAIDRLRALVPPTIEQLDDDGQSEAFARLEEEIAQFTAEPSGAGFDVPPWLDALEQEVDRIHSQVPEEDESLGPYLSLCQVRLSVQEVDKQVKAMVGKA